MGPKLGACQVVAPAASEVMVTPLGLVCGTGFLMDTKSRMAGRKCKGRRVKKRYKGVDGRWKESTREEN